MFLEFDYAGNFNEGFSAVLKDGKWGMYKHQRILCHF